MSGAITATVVGGAIANKGNKDARKASSRSTPKFARQLVEPIGRQLDRTADTTVASFGGDRVANFTDDQNQALTMSQALAQRLGGQADTAGTGFQDFASGSMINNNPYLDSSIAAMRDSALTDFNRNQIPSINNTAILDGGLGGTRQGVAQGVALGDLNQDLIGAESGMRQTQFNTDMSNQLQALIQQGAILGGQTRPQDLLLRTGALQQDQEQAEIEGRRQAFNEQNIDQYMRDQELLRILLAGPSGTPPTPQQTNPLVAGLGAATTASQLFPRQQPTPVQTTPNYYNAPGTRPGDTFV